MLLGILHGDVKIELSIASFNQTMESFGLLSLPEDLLQMSFFPFLSMKDLVRLDGASLNRVGRAVLLRLFSGHNVCKTVVMPSKCFAKWVAVRGMFLHGIEFGARATTESISILLKYRVNSKIQKLTFVNDFNLSILEVMKLVRSCGALTDVDMVNSVSLYGHHFNKFRTPFPALKVLRCRITGNQLPDFGKLFPNIEVLELELSFLYGFADMWRENLLNAIRGCTRLRSLIVRGCGEWFKASLFATDCAKICPELNFLQVNAESRVLNRTS